MPEFDLLRRLRATIDVRYENDERMMCICPFHKDTKPSLAVYKDDMHFHCFGCGAHGTVFQLLARTPRRYRKHNDDDVLKARWGYRLIKEGRVEEAFELFKLEGDKLRQRVRELALEPVHSRWADWSTITCSRGVHREKQRSTQGK
mgnify:CR=1 FL=1